MDITVLNTESQNLLPKLGKFNSLKNAYLAGGSALALQISHRRSYDLDFFTSKLSPLSFWQQELSVNGKFELLHSHEQGYLGLLNKVQISLNSYPYPLLETCQTYQNLKIASLKDLTAMKLFALLERTRKKDIIDLYFLAQTFSLDEMFIFFEHKFEGLEISETTLLKALSDLDEIEEEPIDLIKKVSWKETKNFWQQQVKEYVEKTH